MVKFREFFETNFPTGDKHTIMVDLKAKQKSTEGCREYKDD